MPNRRLPIGQKGISQRTLWFDRAHHPEFVEGRLCGEMSESLSALSCVNLRLIFLFHVAIIDPPSSIIGSRASPLSPQHSLLSTDLAVRPQRLFGGLLEVDRVGVGQISLQAKILGG